MRARSQLMDRKSSVRPNLNGHPLSFLLYFATEKGDMELTRFYLLSRRSVEAMRTTMETFWVTSLSVGICRHEWIEEQRFCGVSNWLVRTIFAWTNPVSISLILEEYTDFLEQLLGSAKPTIKRLILRGDTNWPEKQVARFLGKSIDYLKCDLEFLGLPELLGARIGMLELNGIMGDAVVMVKENGVFRARDESLLWKNLHNVSARTLNYEIYPYDTIDRPIEATTELVFHHSHFFFENYIHVFEKFPNLQSVALIFLESWHVTRNLEFGLTKMFEEGFLEKWQEKNVKLHFKGTDLVYEEPSFLQSKLLARTNGRVTIELSKRFCLTDSIEYNNFRITFQDANVEVDVNLKQPCYSDDSDSA